MAVLTKRTYVAHPEGMFAATIATIEAKTIETKDGTRSGFNICFRTDEGEITPWVSDTYSEKSNLGRVVKSCLGSMPDTLNTDSLLGRSCRLVIAHEQKGELTVDKVLQYLSPAGAADLFAGQ